VAGEGPRVHCVRDGDNAALVGGGLGTPPNPKWFERHKEGERRDRSMVGVDGGKVRYGVQRAGGRFSGATRGVPPDRQQSAVMGKGSQGEKAGWPQGGRGAIRTDMEKCKAGKQNEK